MKRRQVLLSGGAALLLAGAAGLYRVPNYLEACHRRRPPMPRDASLFRDRESARVVGARCLDHLRRIGEAPTPARLTIRLARAIGADPRGLSTADSRSVSRALAARISDDFDHERIVLVDGWMLSLTETRLFALSAMAA